MKDLKSVEHYLCEYSLAEVRIDVLREELDDLLSSIQVAAATMKNVDNSGDVDELSDKAQQLSDILSGEINAIADRCEKIVEMVNALEDPEMRVVLECRYFKQMTFSKIAKKLYISKTKAQDLHKRGLAEADAYLRNHNIIR